MRILGWVLVFLVFFSSLSMAEEPVKVAILPFNIHAPQDLSYVREGIQDMLTTRLFTPGKVETIDPEVVREALAELKTPLTRETARKLGEKLGVDYVLYGSVSVFGNTVSLDAELLPVKAEKSPITLYTQVEGLGGVIPELARFAKRSRAYILGEPFVPEPVSQARVERAPAPTSSTPVYRSPVRPPEETPAKATATPVPPSKLHPEKLVRVAPPPAAAPETSPPPATQAPKTPPVHYVDEDQWPDYPPSEEALPPVKQSSPPVAPVIEERPPEKKKKSFLRRLASKLWPFGKKEKEVKLSEVPPPPPPPPPAYEAPATSPPVSGAATPPTTPPAGSPQPPTAPPPQGTVSASPAPPAAETWQWY